MCLHFIWHECTVFLNYRLFKYQHYESGERQSPRAHRLARLTDLACVTSSRFSGRYCFKKKKKQRWTVSEKLLRLTSIFCTFVHTHACPFPMNTHRKCVYYIYSCIHDMHWIYGHEIHCPCFLLTFRSATPCHHTSFPELCRVVWVWDDSIGSWAWPQDPGIGREGTRMDLPGVLTSKGSQVPGKLSGLSGTSK